MTSREIRDRLLREARTNISLEIGDTDKAGIFTVNARGAMQVAVLVETMRREGYEVLVSRPVVIEKRSMAAAANRSRRSTLRRQTMRSVV